MSTLKAATVVNMLGNDQASTDEHESITNTPEVERTIGDDIEMHEDNFDLVDNMRKEPKKMQKNKTHKL